MIINLTLSRAERTDLNDFPTVKSDACVQLAISLAFWLVATSLMDFIACPPEGVKLVPALDVPLCSRNFRTLGRWPKIHLS